MQLTLAVLLVGILANPLCVCADEPTTTPAQEKSCCKPPAEDSSLPIAPCDCETALTDGLLLAKEDYGRRYDFRGPPMRHLLSIYRL